ncbi:MAG: DUF2752 domain-containing protein [Elusimicrobiota bacterium]|nr:MAG: DUF2752 domain-containing protein [Elusimicrobiota bacterium]
MNKPLPFFPVALAAWLACAAQAVLGIPEGLVLCPFRLVTGHRCPGCGMGHAVVHAMRGNWAESLRHHPIGIALLAVWTGWLLLEASRYFFGAAFAPGFASGRGTSSNVASRP